MLVINDRKLKSLRDEIISFLKLVLSLNKEALLRGDYKECAELMLILLGETLSRRIHWLKPGAFHKARWMAIMIYGAKMYAFSDQLNYTSEKIKNLHRICLFKALIFIKVWLGAPKAPGTPLNDLSFWKTLNFYSKIDPEISQAALTSFMRHFWCLTEETVIFALFSKKVSDPEKKKLCQLFSSMNTIRNRHSFPACPLFLI